MKINTFGGLALQGVKSLWRNGWMSIASIATVTITLFIFGLFFLLVLNTNYIADSVESDVEIAAFLVQDLSEEESKAIGDKLKTIVGVSEVTLVPKEKSLEQLTKTFGREHDLVAALDGKNPLPDYYRVKTLDPTQVGTVAKLINRMAEIEDVRYGQEYVDKLFAVTHWVRLIGLALMSLLSIAAVFLIATTIRLTVFARRREIAIMKLVGATNWFIRWPFFLEGTFLGLIGASIAVLILLFSYMGVIEQLTVTLQFIPLLTDVSLLKQLLLGMILAGMALGACGSAISLRKFLDV
ncbi:MAG: permease-like cell division protein FtsX [Bacillota bacterium]|nr:permease-like cell division protein FtsX [Bacillota bacterium]